MRGGPVAPPDSDHIEIRHQIDGGALAVAVCIVGLPVFPSSQSRMPTLVAQEQATFNERIVPAAVAAVNNYSITEPLGDLSTVNLTPIPRYSSLLTDKLESHPSCSHVHRRRINLHIFRGRNVSPEAVSSLPPRRTPFPLYPQCPPSQRQRLPSPVRPET
jgi:hypothetical protein